MKHINPYINKSGFLETNLRDILPFKKIDDVLRYLLNADNPPFRLFSEIQKGVNWEAETKELMEILDKLERDGYIRTEIGSDSIKRYYSTFDGRFFMTQSDGYMKKIETDYQARIRADQNENRKWSNDEKLIRVTRLAGIAGGLLFLMEVVKFVYQICHR